MISINDHLHFPIPRAGKSVLHSPVCKSAEERMLIAASMGQTGMTYIGEVGIVDAQGNLHTTFAVQKRPKFVEPTFLCLTGNVAGCLAYPLERERSEEYFTTHFSHEINIETTGGAALLARALAEKPPCDAGIYEQILESCELGKQVHQEVLSGFHGGNYLRSLLKVLMVSFPELASQILEKQIIENIRSYAAALKKNSYSMQF